MKHFLITAYLLLIAACLPAQAKIFLIFGAQKGWIGQQLMSIVQEKGHNPLAAQSRLENRESLELEIEASSPDYIINAAGVTGTPNIDWCESHKHETLRANIIGALTLADVACSHGIPVVNIGTGCIYEYDERHPLGSGMGFTEEEEPNFHGSFYSATKVVLDKLLLYYPNVLNLRIRMPISNDSHPRNFITKISKYRKVINVPNSMSILADLLPLIPEMAERGLRGNYNFVNPGVISHNEILELYKKYIDPAFTYQNFTIEEQNQVLKAKRSNNELDATKLLKEFPGIPHIQKSIINVFEKMSCHKEQSCS